MAEVESTSSGVTIMGRIIVEQNLASNEEVESVMARWQSSSGESNTQTLAEMLVGEGVITAGQAKRVIAQINEKRGQQQVPGYKILKKLGEGAMGRVYKAHQLSLDRLVAIKVLPRRFSKDENFVERFYAEGRAAARLNHPNIIAAYDVGQAGEYHYFVMEYVEGRSVWDDLDAHGAYSEADALRIAIDMAEALGHATEAGFIHRDVKPKNIMLTTEDEAKLADMGLARAMDDREAAEAEAGKAFGTPFYISPEQIRGDVDIDARADIYGLGATLYHMIVGQVPFDGANPSQVMQKHLREDLVPPDHINSELSAGVSEIVEVMMAKDRGQRYADWAGVLEDLRAVAAGRPPIEARKNFDLGSLADLESTGDPAEQSNPAVPMPGPTAPGLLEQPLFWVAAVSLVINIILLIMMALAD